MDTHSTPWQREQRFASFKIPFVRQLYLLSAPSHGRGPQLYDYASRGLGVRVTVGRYKYSLLLILILIHHLHYPSSIKQSSFFTETYRYKAAQQPHKPGRCLHTKQQSDRSRSSTTHHGHQPSQLILDTAQAAIRRTTILTVTTAKSHPPQTEWADHTTPAAPPQRPSRTTI
jgi:hypothetical protein